MVNFLSDSIADLYVRRNIILPEEKEVYKCGVELILNDIITFSLVILISTIFFKARFALEFLITLCFTRVYCGGYHAAKAYMCRLSMLITFFGVILLSYILAESPELILYIILILSFVVLLPLIPVKHPNKTLTQELIAKNRKKGIITYIIFGMLSILICHFANRQDAFIISLSLSAVTVLAVIGTLVNERRCRK